MQRLCPSALPRLSALSIKATGMIRSVHRRWCFWILCFSCAAARSAAQDTLSITLPQAEKLFLQQNLTLLAERYNIDIARAQVIQARLYNNPGLSFSGDIYNPELHKAFDLSGQS